MGTRRCRRHRRSVRSAAARGSGQAPTARQRRNRRTGWGKTGSFGRLLGGRCSTAQLCLPPPPMTPDLILPLVVGYVLGSIPFGLLLTRVSGKGDIRAIGSG